MAEDTICNMLMNIFLFIVSEIKINNMKINKRSKLSEIDKLKISIATTKATEKPEIRKRFLDAMEKRKGKPSINKGTKRTKAAKLRISIKTRKAMKNIDSNTREKLRYWKDKISPNIGRKHTEEAKKKIRKARAKQKFPFNDTKIEVILQKALDKENIRYTKQKYSLPGTPDIFIEPNICIFADGDYWHNLPGRIKRDKYINKQLKEMNYIVLRFWEHEILSNVDECLKTIKTNTKYDLHNKKTNEDR